MLLGWRNGNTCRLGGCSSHSWHFLGCGSAYGFLRFLGLRRFRHLLGGDGSSGRGRLRWLGSLGVQTVLGSVAGTDDIRPVEVMGREVIPAVADL